MRLVELNVASRETFVEVLGPVFEHSPWVAEAACAARPFASVEALHAAMLEAIHAASEEDKRALIGAHPDLAGRAARAGALTEASGREQAGAGLDRLSAEEYERFHRLNAAYRERFGFPFIIAVRQHTKESILEAFARRLANEEAEETAEALRNIGLIGRFRLFELVRE